MRKFELMTTFHRKGYEMYGKNMIESVLKYWPKEIDFTQYTGKKYYPTLMTQDLTMWSYMRRVQT